MPLGLGRFDVAPCFNPKPFAAPRRLGTIVLRSTKLNLAGYTGQANARPLCDRRVLVAPSDTFGRHQDYNTVH
jgi:hypothetical protein